MHAPIPLTRELLLIGGGHTHALVLRMWGMRPLPGVRLTVINPHATAPYTGMLPGFIAGHYDRAALDIDLVRLARFADARLILDRVVAIDPKARRATLQSGRILPFHATSIDIGITSDLPSLTGFADFGVPAKPLDVFANKWAAFSPEKPANIVIIGGGVGGVELAMAMQHGQLKKSGAKPNVTIIERSALLSEVSNSTRNLLKKTLQDLDISVIENTDIQSVSADRVTLADGTDIPVNFVVGAAGAKPQGWLATTGLHLTDGFVTVDATLRSINAPDIFAVGDCAHLSHAPRPKAGVFAVREAPILYENLRAIASGGKLRRFQPQKDYLKLISLGEKAAVGQKWGLRAYGKTLWRWKDHIDRTFMDQFHALQPMKLPTLPAVVAEGVPQALGDKPMCGGCGSKVGANQLADVLQGQNTSDRADILSGPGDDAAILAGPNGSFQVISTDHLRAFTADPWRMAEIAAVHALGDIWAMGAAPQFALATIILPRLSPEMQTDWLHEIMTAANNVFSRAGAAIVGGHTSVGSELTIGFTVTGLRDKAPITLAGAKPGDHIVLTKPIGSGTVLAGEMAMQADGSWVADALDQMSRSQADAARLLSKAHAMTDVTGFGLAGHLLGIARASGVSIDVSLDAVPFLEGAVELAGRGVRSTIYAANRAQLPELQETGDPREALLFDPQTSGGFAAAVSAKQSAAILRALLALGYDAKIIGRCLAGPASLRLT